MPKEKIYPDYLQYSDEYDTSILHRLQRFLLLYMPFGNFWLQLLFAQQNDNQKGIYRNHTHSKLARAFQKRRNQKRLRLAVATLTFVLGFAAVLTLSILGIIALLSNPLGWVAIGLCGGFALAYVAYKAVHWLQKYINKHTSKNIALTLAPDQKKKDALNKKLERKSGKSIGLTAGDSNPLASQELINTAQVGFFAKSRSFGFTGAVLGGLWGAGVTAAMIFGGLTLFGLSLSGVGLPIAAVILGGLIFAAVGYNIGRDYSTHPQVNPAKEFLHIEEDSNHPGNFKRNRGIRATILTLCAFCGLDPMSSYAIAGTLSAAVRGRAGSNAHMKLGSWYKRWVPENSPTKLPKAKVLGEALKNNLTLNFQQKKTAIIAALKALDPADFTYTYQQEVKKTIINLVKEKSLATIRLTTEGLPEISSVKTQLHSYFTQLCNNPKALAPYNICSAIKKAYADAKKNGQDGPAAAAAQLQKEEDDMIFDILVQEFPELEKYLQTAEYFAEIEQEKSAYENAIDLILERKAAKLNPSVNNDLQKEFLKKIQLEYYHKQKTKLRISGLFAAGAQTIYINCAYPYQGLKHLMHTYLFDPRDIVYEHPHHSVGEGILRHIAMISLIVFVQLPLCGIPALVLGLGWSALQLIAFLPVTSKLVAAVSAAFNPIIESKGFWKTLGLTLFAPFRFIYELTPAPVFVKVVESTHKENTTYSTPIKVLNWITLPFRTLTLYVMDWFSVGKTNWAEKRTLNLQKKYDALCKLEELAVGEIKSDHTNSAKTYEQYIDKKEAKRAALEQRKLARASAAPVTFSWKTFFTASAFPIKQEDKPIKPHFAPSPEGTLVLCPK